jgi:tetratricopeptide (TPR) repeat protein
MTRAFSHRPAPHPSQQASRCRIARAFARAALVPALAALVSGCVGTQKPASAPGAEIGAVVMNDPNAAPQVSAEEAQQRAKAAFAEGVRLEASGDLAAAAASFDGAFAADPKLSFAGYDAGLLRERLGDEAGARTAYVAVLDANPGFGPAAQNLARMDVRAGRIEEAERAVRARLEKSPEAVGLRIALAETLLAAGKLGASEEESRRALKADEKNVPAMVNLATVYYRKNRFELARMVLENARQVNDADPAVWNRLGFVETALGNRPQALESFKTAAALRPDYPEAHANYGALLADAEDFAAAVTELELAVKYAPRSAQTWMNLGNAYRGTKAFDRAEAAYKKALELDPGLVDVHYDLAVLYLDGEKPGTSTLARLEQALAFFDTYEAKGGKEPRIAEYRKDAGRAMEREKKRLVREERDRLRKEAEAKKKQEEARKEAELQAQKDAEQAAAKQAAEGAKAPAATEVAPAPAPAASDVPTPPPPPASGPAPAVEPAAATASPTVEARTLGEERSDR